MDDQTDQRARLREVRVAAGRKGGQTTRDRHGTEHFRRAGRIGGSKGGSTTRDRYGSAHFKELGRKSGVARAAKLLATSNDDQGEAMSIDYPRAWEIARAAKMEDHDPKCSFRTEECALLCDCPVVTQHPEYLDDVLQTAGGVPYQKPSTPQEDR